MVSPYWGGGGILTSLKQKAHSQTPKDAATYKCKTNTKTQARRHPNNKGTTRLAKIAAYTGSLNSTGWGGYCLCMGVTISMHECLLFSRHQPRRGMRTPPSQRHHYPVLQLMMFLYASRNENKKKTKDLTRSEQEGLHTPHFSHLCRQSPHSSTTPRPAPGRSSRGMVEIEDEDPQTS